MKLEVIVLAAGKGSRMYSAQPKVLHQLAGEPLLAHVLRVVRELDPHAVHVVHGYGGEAVRARFDSPDIQWAEQEKQQGTGHAVQCALPAVADDATVLIVYGDVPLIRADTLQQLVTAAAAGRLALLSVRLDDPTGYGRVCRDDQGAITAIVEHRDATEEQRRIPEINTGFMAASAHDLKHWLQQIDNKNGQGEYYLTDTVEIALGDGAEIIDVCATDPHTVLGVNTKLELAELERCLRRQRAQLYLHQGVTIVDPDRFDPRGEISFGRDCVVDVNVVLEGPLTIGSGVRIEPNSIVRRSVLGDHVVVKPQCVIDDADIGDHCVIGPFARVRPGSKIGSHAHIGNFVEIKNSDLGVGTKVNHLSYVGDSSIGRNVNIGAGVITCNYDGASKHRTDIEDDVFVGSNSQLVAPVKVGRGATIGAGSTITTDVPAGSLAVSRAGQQHVQHWKRPQKKSD